MDLINLFNRAAVPYDGCVESQQGGRPENQDRVDFCDTPFGRLVLVCDGMGGGPSGAVASSEAIATIIEFIKNAEPTITDKQKLLTDAVLTANLHLRQMQEIQPSLRGMGTTCICLLVDKYSAAVAQVGDSRLYQLRFGKKHWRTWDHSVLLDKIKTLYGRTAGKDVDDAVEEARVSPNSNILSRALGVLDDVVVETHELPYERGDRFVLCSDGVWGAMPEKELLHLLNAKEIGGAMSGTMCRVQEIGANNGNHHDNYTLALLQVNRYSKLKDHMTHKARIIIYALATLCLLCIVAILILLFKNKNAHQNEMLLNAKYDEVVATNQSSLENNQQLSQKIDSLERLLKTATKNEVEKSVPKITNIQSADTTKVPTLTADLNMRNEIQDLCDKINSELDAILVWSNKHPKRQDLGSKQKDNYDQAKSYLKKLSEIIEALDIDNKSEALAICNHVIFELGVNLRVSHPDRTRAEHYTILIEKVTEIKTMINK